MTKTLNIVFLLLFVVPMFTFAQKKEAPELKVKFGKISEEEIAMKQYDKDPDAAAVILFDIGYCSPIGNFSGFERHRRIKIFKKEGYDEANLRIVFNRKRKQSVSGLKAICFNMDNGKMTETKATKDNIYEESITKDIFVQKLTIPGVREGSIIDIKYTLDNPGVQDWYFQDDIPTLWSEYKLAIPEFYHFSKIGQGVTPYLYNDQSREGETITGTNFSFTKYTYHWIQKDVPAIKQEKYMSSIEDYRTKLTFYLETINFPGEMMERVLPTWEELSKELMTDVDFGKFIEKKSAMEEEVATVVKADMAPIQKVQAIYDYVGKTFETTENMYSLWMTSSIAKAKEKKKITATEKNLIVMNMLHTAGIKVAPVLIRTRDEGRVSTPLAVISRFNRVITHVTLEKDTFFMDVSGYPQPMKLLPLEALTGYGMKFPEKEKYETVNPVSKIASRKYIQSQLSVNTEGGLAGDITITNSGYEAHKMRKSLKESGEEKVAQTIFKDVIADGKIEKHSFDAPEITLETPIKGNFKFNTNAYINKAEDKIYISPFTCFGEKENPFKADERLYNVDFGAATDEYFSINITIPEGYKLEELPKAMRISMPENSMRYEYLTALNGTTLTINTKLIVKKTIFNAEEYALLKELYAKMIGKMGEQVVLTKGAADATNKK
jgi:hypothetical protein